MLESSTLIMWMAEECRYSSKRASTIWKALLQKYAPYVTDREQSTWFKERERSREPVPGWHSCALLCEETF
jgi:hypothetical protein